MASKESPSKKNNKKADDKRFVFRGNTITVGQKKGLLDIEK